MEKSERSFFLYDDRKESTITVKAIRKKYKWLADCPFHVHGIPSLVINPYDGTFECTMCLRKGRLWMAEEMNKREKECVGEVVSIAEVLERMIEHLKEGKKDEPKIL